MKPHELAEFAREIRGFSPRDIDRLHRVLFRLQEDHLEFTPDTVDRQYNAILSEDGRTRISHDPCLQWLLDLLGIDQETPLNEKFLDVLQEAHIVLTTDGTTTDGETDYDVPRKDVSIQGRLSARDRSHSPEAFDEDDILWRQAVALDNRKLASQALEQWRHVLQLRREALLDHEDPAMNQMADELYRRNLARKAISHWRNTIKEMQDLERVAIMFRARKDAASALKTWTLAAREKLFTRIRDERLLQKILDTWRGKATYGKMMEAAADEFRDRQAVHNTIARLMNKEIEVKRSENQADNVYQQNILRRALNIWLGRIEQLRTNQRRADAAAEYFASKHSLQSWRDKTRTRRDEKHAREAREQMLAVKYFRRWQTFVKHSKEVKYTAAYKAMRRKIKMNIGRAALNTWRQKTARVQEMRTTADGFRTRKSIEISRKTAHNIIIVMFNKTEQSQNANQQADTFHNKKLVHRLDIFGPNWLDPTRQILENQRKADEYHAIKNASFTLSKLRNWRNLAFRTKRLEEDADALFQRNVKKRVLGILQKWKKGAAKVDEEEAAREDRMVPVTPAARRSHLLVSTTPAYTPGTGLFGGGRRVVQLPDEDEE